MSVGSIDIITLATPSKRFEKPPGLRQMGVAAREGSSREELSREQLAPKKHQWDHAAKREYVL